jgi:hypothetical protein
LGTPDIEFVRGERMRLRVQRQRREIMQLQRAGIPGTSAQTLLDWMLNRIDDLCTECEAEDRAIAQDVRRSALVRWFDDEQEPSPFLKALEEVRRMGHARGLLSEARDSSMLPPTMRVSIVSIKMVAAWKGDTLKAIGGPQFATSVFTTSFHSE